MTILLWTKWAGGIYTRSDGYTIYQDFRWAMLVHESGAREKFRTVEAAKKAADEKAQGGAR